MTTASTGPATHAYLTPLCDTTTGQSPAVTPIMNTGQSITLIPQIPLMQWFLMLLEVLNPANFISAFTEPFVIGKIKYDFFKT